MKKEFLNTCYKFFNRYITVDELIKELDNIDNKTKELNDLINEIKDNNKEIDLQDKWLKVFNVINDNDYFNTCFDSLTDYELLEFIAQNISAPFPPKLSQEEFDKLVKVGIEHDEKEWLWRLAFNYDESGINFDKIVDYYIKVKDSYYLSELISAVGRSLDIDSIIDKLTDQELIKGLLENKDVINVYVSDEQFKKLESKL